jgi:hypothetical protein
MADKKKVPVESVSVSMLWASGASVLACHPKSQPRESEAFESQKLPNPA